MFEKLIIKNFQGHKKKTIEFDPLVTTLVGPSDVGKSSIIRALGWVCFNQPAGDTFTREGQDYVRARLFVSGHEIIRDRGSGDNFYTLDGERFVKLERGVPPEIATLLNVQQLNFQRQHDGNFWFCLTAGQVARELNSIVNLDVIDSSLSKIAASIRRTNTELSLTQEDITKTKQELTRLSYVPDIVQELNTLEELQEQARKLALQRARLGGVVQGCHNATKGHQRASQAAGWVGAVVGLGQRAVGVGQRKAELGLLLAQLKNAKIASTRIVPSTRKLDTLKIKLENICTQRNKLVSLLSKIKQQGRESCQLNIDAEKVSQELNSLTKGRCPICNSNLSQEKTKS